MVDECGGPIPIENLTIRDNGNNQVDGLRRAKQRYPDLLARFFAPKNVLIHPWHFPHFLTEPEFIRHPTAESITIVMCPFGLEASKDKIYDFLYDKDGYANKEAVRLWLVDENRDILEKLIEVSY